MNCPEEKKGVLEMNKVAEVPGVKIRWFNDACYEIVLPGGKVVLVDPYIDDSQYCLRKADEVTGADYILVSHSHFDHITQIPDMLKRFHSKIFMGKNSVKEFAKYYNIPGYPFYACSPGDVFEMEDCKIEAFFAKHTSLGEKDAPANWNALCEEYGYKNSHEQFAEVNRCGSYEYLNYMITTKNQIRILIWGGGIDYESLQRAKKYEPDVAIVQFTRSEPEKSAMMCEAVGGQVVFPHHHEPACMETVSYTHLMIRRSLFIIESLFLF